MSHSRGFEVVAGFAFIREWDTRREDKELDTIGADFDDVTSARLWIPVAECFKRLPLQFARGR